MTLGTSIDERSFKLQDVVQDLCKTIALSTDKNLKYRPPAAINYWYTTRRTAITQLVAEIAIKLND